MEERDVEAWKAALGAEARKRRRSQKLTTRELARRTGLPENFIGAVKTDRREPSLSTILALAKGLDVGVHELFGGAGPSPRAFTLVIGFDDPDAAQYAAVLGLARSVLRSRAHSRGKTPSKPPKRTK